MERNGHLEWNVAYQPGTLVANGFAKGKLIVSEQIETTDAPAKVILESDRVVLKADGEDVAVITVQLKDKKNHFVPTANNEITFTISGPGKIAGVGNGDPASHEPEQFVKTVSDPLPQWKRKTFNGLAQIIIKTTTQPGKITLTASADGLVPAILILRSTNDNIKK